tara:strand:- start:98 stop:352 length:255 start_codon:yes stop_codon:yes gene_type:complete
MNTQIDLVKKWIDDPASVSKDELKANASRAAHLGLVASIEKDAADAATAACSRAVVTFEKDIDFIQAYVDAYERINARRIKCEL